MCVCVCVYIYIYIYIYILIFRCSYILSNRTQVFKFLYSIHLVTENVPEV